MLSKEDFAVIKALNALGVYQKDIAAHLGVHPKTVRRALQRDRAPAAERQKRGSVNSRPTMYQRSPPRVYQACSARVYQAKGGNW